MAKTGWCIVGVIVACSGCGSSGPSDTDATATGGASSGGSSASGGSPAVGGSDTGGQSTGGAPASGGAQGTGGVGSGGAGAVLPSDLFPLALGNRWTYVVLNDPTGYCDQTYLDEEAYATDELDGVSCFVLSSPCYAPDPAYDSRLAVVDDEVVQRLDETWRAVLKAPVAEGTGWIVPYGTESFGYGWYFEGEVTVPAGTFQNCWSRRLSPPEASPDIDTYCPGVGPVRRTSTDLTIELASYLVQ